jgi:hypothetical protein
MFFKKNKNKKKLTLDQMCYTNALCLEAIVNTLVKKDVCTKEEVLSEVKRLSETVGKEEGTP